MADEKEEKQVKANDAKGSSSSSPLVVILMIVNCAVVGFVAFQQFQFMKKEAEKPSVEDLVMKHLDEQGSAESREELASNTRDEGLLLPLENFTVNLAQGSGPRRYLRLKTVLKFNSNSKQEEFQARKPQIRDAIISILNSKKPSDLLQREGKLFLKEEIKNAVNSFLINGSVVDVFYVSFQIN